MLLVDWWISIWKQFRGKFLFCVTFLPLYSPFSKRLLWSWEDKSRFYPRHWDPLRSKIFWSLEVRSWFYPPPLGKIFKPSFYPPFIFNILVDKGGVKRLNGSDCLKMLSTFWHCIPSSQNTLCVTNPFEILVSQMFPCHNFRAILGLIIISGTSIGTLIDRLKYQN